MALRPLRAALNVAVAPMPRASPEAYIQALRRMRLRYGAAGVGVGRNRGAAPPSTLSIRHSRVYLTAEATTTTY